MRVTQSGLIYEGQDKKDQVVWVWQHVRGISCDGRVIRIVVNKNHRTNEEYWFTSKHIATLFFTLHVKKFHSIEKKKSDYSGSHSHGRGNCFSKHNNGSSVRSISLVSSSPIKSHSFRRLILSKVITKRSC